MPSARDAGGVEVAAVKGVVASVLGLVAAIWPPSDAEIWPPSVDGVHLG